MLTARQFPKALLHLSASYPAPLCCHISNLRSHVCVASISVTSALSAQCSATALSPAVLVVSVSPADCDRARVAPVLQRERLSPYLCHICVTSSLRSRPRHLRSPVRASVTISVSAPRPQHYLRDHCVCHRCVCHHCVGHVIVTASHTRLLTTLCRGLLLRMYQQ